MNNALIIKDFVSLFYKELKDYYPKGEIDTLIFLTLNDLLGMDRAKIELYEKKTVRREDAKKILSVINELKTHKPIQYILGETFFYGCKIKVNENVLIPRPETEELTDWIISDTQNSKPETLLDIGTGSGCIAIALSKNFPHTNVFAIDISDESLLVAKANAIFNQTKIDFLQADIIALSQSTNSPINNFDIIVSNPPYILSSEKKKMAKNVINYEPHLALFVNDDEPLLFYKAIANFAKKNLNKNGKLYLEINEALGSEVKKLLSEKGFKNVEVKKDMSGKERMVKGIYFENSVFRTAQ
ncbi:MAG: peptide chain release factor N(5)-glutamine methyltransferase [Bacteroidota bacterium]